MRLVTTWLLISVRPPLIVFRRPIVVGLAVVLRVVLRLLRGKLSIDWRLVVRRHEDWHAGWARISELLLRLPLVVRVVVAAAVVALAAVVSIIMVDVALTPTRSSIRCMHRRLIDQIRYRDGHSMLVDLCLGA
jgi:hypothetical protein